jgi:hypothetical protein
MSADSTPPTPCQEVRWEHAREIALLPEALQPRRGAPAALKARIRDAHRARLEAEARTCALLVSALTPRAGAPAALKARVITEVKRAALRASAPIVCADQTPVKPTRAELEWVPWSWIAAFAAAAVVLLVLCGRRHDGDGLISREPLRPPPSAAPEAIRPRPAGPVVPTVATSAPAKAPAPPPGRGQGPARGAREPMLVASAPLDADEERKLYETLSQKVWSSKAPTVDDVRLLRAICGHLGNRTCREQASKKLETMVSLQPSEL